MFLSRIKEDIQTIFDNDPAAKTILEVIICYPGLHALLLHRVSHKLYVNKIPLLPRIISNLSREKSNIFTFENDEISNPSLCKEIHTIDINIDKFVDYCARVLNKIDTDLKIAK